VQTNMVELAEMPSAAVVARPAVVAQPAVVARPAVVAQPAVVAPSTAVAPADTPAIRYSPEQNMVELVDEPIRPRAAAVDTTAMGAAPAVGQPVRQPRIEAQSLDSR
jgi:hypothetical protein